MVFFLARISVCLRFRFRHDLYGHFRLTGIAVEPVLVDEEYVEVVEGADESAYRATHTDPAVVCCGSR